MIPISPQYYNTIYLLFITVLTFGTIFKYGSYRDDRLYDKFVSSDGPVFFLSLILTVFIGLRPVSGQYFGDMSGYSDGWDSTRYWMLTWNTDNKIFDNLFGVMATSGIDRYCFFSLVAAIYFGGIAWACYKLFPKDAFESFVIYLGALSTFSYGTNGIKAGAAASIFLVALAMRDGGKKWWSVIFVLLAWGFHHSMQVLVVAFVVCSFVRKTKYYRLFWLMSLIIAVLHISFFQTLFAGFVDEHGAAYLVSTDEGTIGSSIKGFRPDFILYGSVPIIVGWIAEKKKGIKSENYTFLLNLYTLSNAVWLLCMYAEYTNRIAYLSWQLLPIVMIYPLLREAWGNRQYATFRTVALYHLAFTLFMTFIYYA